jgi:hypothetical protein
MRRVITPPMPFSRLSCASEHDGRKAPTTLRRHMLRYAIDRRFPGVITEMRVALRSRYLSVA